MHVSIKRSLYIKHYSCRYTSTPADTVAAGLLGGCDLDCGSYYQQHAQVGEMLWCSTSVGYSTIQEAIDGKTITEADIDNTLTRLFTYR